MSLQPKSIKSWTPVANSSPATLEERDIPAKTPAADDVDVKVLYCGVCASDVTALDGESGPLVENAVYGHEVVGEVVAVGPEAEGIKVGDIVGIGAQSDCCRTCEFCEEHNDQFCAKNTFSISLPFGKYQRGPADGEFPHGGFAKFWRGPSRFAVKIPSGLDPAVAAPLLCAGVTVYSPMLHYGVGTRAMRVGVVGIGGLGHLAIQFAKAMGARVTAISRGTGKKDDALALGADEYISTSSDLASDFKGHERSLDLIICTINPPELEASSYIPLLRPRGTFVVLGLIQKDFTLSPMALLMGASGVAASAIGSPDELRQMFDLAVKHNIRPWITKYNFDDVNLAIEDFRAGKPRFRFVLVNTDNGGSMA